MFIKQCEGMIKHYSFGVKLKMRKLFLSCGLLCLFILGCSTLKREPLLTTAEIKSPYILSASAYLDKASSREGIEKKALLIKAAGSLIEQRELTQASNLLFSLKGLPKNLKIEKQILIASINYLKGRVSLSFRQLKQIPLDEALAPDLELYYLNLRANVAKAFNQPQDEIDSRMALSNKLPAINQLYNQQQLWFALKKLSKSKVCSVDEESGFLQRGYFSLSCLSRDKQGNIKGLLENLVAWQDIYKGHPANILLPQNLNKVSVNTLENNVAKIGLMLPLSGELAGPGKAIRDGFLNSYYQDKQKKPKVTFIDSESDDINRLYHKANQEGVSLVIGPLTKTRIRQLLAKQDGKPTIVLNDINQASEAPFYQFGLSQANEAIQVAREMSERGKRRALIIAPDGGWADEVVAAFSNTFSENNGQIVDSFRYQNDGQFKQGIRQLLGVDKSMARNDKIKRLLGRQVKTVIERRDDFDAIFLLAYPSKARQIKPLLNYYYAGDVDTFATSIVYSGVIDSYKDRDLNGIWFCDMPYVLKQKRFSKQPKWQEQHNSYIRLFALGLDSYLLSKQLPELTLFPLLGLSDNTGVLFLTDSGHIVRRLPFARFVNGIPA